MRKLMLITFVIIVVMFILYQKGYLNDEGKEMVDNAVESVVNNPKLSEVPREALQKVLGEKIRFNEDGTYAIDFKTISIEQLNNLIALLEE